MKDRWDDEEYEVVHQVTPDVPVYKVRDRSGNARVVHQNRLFLVASVSEPVTPLSLDAELLEATSEWSTLAELTPLEFKSNSPEETMWGGIDPMPNSWNAARMVRWHTMAASYGGPKFNQKWVKHWKGVGQ